MDNPFDTAIRGPLAFPVTPFHPDRTLDLESYRSHLRWLLSYEPPALFVACGTGELAALGPEEVGALVRATLLETGGRTPVYAGAGHGLAVARDMARAAHEAGADGLLLLPPYLTTGEQAGLAAYVRAVASASPLPLILYHRDNGLFEPATVVELAKEPKVLGLKDGHGDVERMQRIVQAVGGRLAYFNGMPTAEAYQLAYAGIGVPHYSSAVFNFVPEVSWAFHRAVEADDRATAERLLRTFFFPLCELRNRVRGYAVALVKAGAELRRGVPATVRPPLVPVREGDRQALQALIEVGLAEVGAEARLTTS